MKTSKFLGYALSVLTLAACSQDDDLFQNNDAPQTTIENNQIGKVIETGTSSSQSSIATFVVPAATKTVDVVYNNGEKTVTVDVESAGNVTGAFKTVSLNLLAKESTFADIYYTVGAKGTRAASNGTRVAAVKHFAVKPNTSDDIVVEAVEGLSKEDLEARSELFLNKFPEEQDNLNHPGVDNFSKNFLYESDGQPFVIYPIYMETSSHDDFGIFYYDENGDLHEQIVWESGQVEQEDGKYNIPGLLQGENGIKITLRKGYKYGFYIDEAGVGKFYSYAEENYKICTETDHGEFPCLGNGCHAVTFTDNGQTYMGFEDWEYWHNPEWSKYFDCNDVIFSAPQTLAVVDAPVEENLIPEVIYYTVTYYAGGADGTVPAKMFDQAGDATFTVAAPSELVYPGHTFEGWKDNETGIIYQPGDVYQMDNKDVEFTAQWKNVTITPLPGADPTPTKDEESEGTYYHSSGVAMFETTGEDYDYNDAVLDYDIEGYIPSADSLEAGNWPYLKTTIHLRALSDDQITSVGIDLEGLDKDFFCEADDMYITAGNSLDIKEVLKNTTANIQGTKPNFAEGSYGIDLSGIEWLMTKEACETKYTNSKGEEMFFNKSADPELNYWYNVERDDENFGGDLLTITVVCYPDMSKMTLDEWKEKMEDIICDIENQKFYVTVNGEKNYNCIKAPFLTKHTDETNPFIDAYPEYGKEADWYSKPASFIDEDGKADDYLVYWW